MTRLSRRDLRLIREARGWEAAAEAAGVRKTKKVVSKTGKTYYRPLTREQRRYRISNIIQGKQKVKKPDKIKDARLAIPERDRVKAGRDLQIKDEIRRERQRLRRAENEANRRQIQATINQLKEEQKNTDAEEDVQRAYELAQDTDSHPDWRLFRAGYSATSSREQKRFKKKLDERLKDGMAES
tara:strand:+ start:1840 stop:2391 length:552 start_codon:yes stop_codon:yes gene_type:complete